MASEYIKIGEKVGKKILEKKLVGTCARAGGKVLGIVTGIIIGYEFLKNYDENIKDEPAFQEMVRFEQELMRWGSAISCIGRENYSGGTGSLYEGGCINALSEKKTLEQELIKPDIKEAKELLERAIAYVKETENLDYIKNFDEKKNNLVNRLEKISIEPSKDYSSIQKNLSNIVDAMKKIENSYRTRIYECKTELEKTKINNAKEAAGQTAVSVATLGFVKKKKKK